MYAFVVIYKTLAYGDPVAGYPSLMVVMLFLGGMQLTTMGILGEYLGRVFDESKQRPLYFLKAYHPARLQRNIADTSHAGNEGLIIASTTKVG